MGLNARHRTLVCTQVESNLPHRETVAGVLHKTDFYSREFFSSGVRAGRKDWAENWRPNFLQLLKSLAVLRRREILPLVQDR